MTRVARWLSFVLLVTPSCASSSAPHSSAASSTLPDGIAARAGALEIPLDLVSRVVAARGISPRKARDDLIEDALFAQAAMSAGLDSTSSVRAAIRGSLARSVLVELGARAAQGDPTDLEVENATARHFMDLDRPESFRVVQAVAMFPKAKDIASRARSRAVAERVARAVVGASSAADFREKAEHVARDEIEIKVEELAPVAPDGRIVESDAKGATPSEPRHYEKAFASAAAQLARPGDQSPVVETDFGFHVMMLLERLPGHAVPLEDRRQILAPEIRSDRARKANEELTQRLRRERPPLVERSAEGLTASVAVQAP